MELGKFREAQRLAFEAIAVLASLYLVQMIFFPWDDKTQLFPKFRMSSEKERKKDWQQVWHTFLLDIS